MGKMRAVGSTNSITDYFIEIREKGPKIHETTKNISKSVVQKLFDDKEERRKIYADEVYSLDDWKKAKSWYRHLPTLNGVEILRGYLWVVIFEVLCAIFICCYHYFLEPEGAPIWGDENKDIWQIFNLTSFALALLLVFRTNSSYNRWWEARILWGSQINMTRDIVRRAIAWFPRGEESENLLNMFARWSIMMSFGLKGSLRGQNITPELQRLLPPEELRWASQSSHMPNTIAQVLADILALVEMDEFRRVSLDNNIQRYVDIYGSCERICKTPIHRNWTSHTVRFCILWLSFFPFALWPVYGWATPGIQFVISFLLLGIENIGVQIEEPFAVLALDAYCTVCERGVQQLMSSRHGCKNVVMDVMTGKDKLMSRKYSLGGHNGMRLPVDDSFHSGNVAPCPIPGDDTARPIRGSVEVGGDPPVPKRSGPLDTSGSSVDVAPDFALRDTLDSTAARQRNMAGVYENEMSGHGEKEAEAAGDAPPQAPSLTKLSPFAGG